MNKLYESAPVYNETLEAYEEITVYQVSQQEADEALSLEGCELGDYFGIDVRRYLHTPGSVKIERFVELRGLFLTVLKRTKLEV